MDHAGISTPLHLLYEDFSGIVLGIAGVDDQRQPGVARRRDMRAEAGALTIAVRMVVIIVEPGFSDRDDTAVRRLCDELGSVDIGMGIGLVRVDAHRGPNVGILLCRCNHLIPFTLARRDVEHSLDAGCTGTRERTRLIIDEPFVIQVTVRIDEH